MYIYTHAHTPQTQITICIRHLAENALRAFRFSIVRWPFVVPVRVRRRKDRNRIDYWRKYRVRIASAFECLETNGQIGENERTTPTLMFMENALDLIVHGRHQLFVAIFNRQTNLSCFLVIAQMRNKHIYLIIGRTTRRRRHIRRLQLDR